MIDEVDEPDDRRVFAVHEAGHATVAAIKGQRVRAELRGSAVVDGYFDASGAVAGMVAVEISGDYKNATVDTFVENWNFFRPGMSNTDLARIPEDREKRRAAVEEALLILRKQKELFEEIARQLLEVGTLSADTIAELAKRFRVE
jgi:hypothetical protein